MIRAHGAVCTVVPGSRDHCADVCREKAAQEGLYYTSHVYNPFFYEGTKTYIYEVYEQLGRIPEHIPLPVGNGILFLGVVRRACPARCLLRVYGSGQLSSVPAILPAVRACR